MIDEKINSTANNIQIDIDNLSYVNYLWTQRISDTSIQGIRLDKRNLPIDTVYTDDIPAVNDGTLTIQKNGTAVQTFTANQSSNVTANITVPTKTSDIDNDSGYVTGPSSSTANAVPRYDGTAGKIIKDTGVTISDTNVLSAAQLAANIIETGTGDNNYFQSRKFRGEGNAATYYHAVDFGFAGHNQVDFYEYGGIWNFWKNTNASATTADGNLCLKIGDTYVKNKNNTFTWPTTSGTIALTSNIPTALKNPHALTFGSKTYDGSSAQTITLADLGGQAAGNYAILDSNGKLADSVIPAVAITDTYVVANETAMLALSAQKGDIAIRSDLNKSFVLQATPASTLANWKELLTPTDAVLSVNGKTGTVTLNLDNINDGSTRKLANYVPKSLTSAKGDLIYASAANTPTRLGIGSNGQFLSIADGIPKWVNNPNTDTKNTTGSTDSTEKLYLVGAKTQAANPQTYSNSKVYIQNNKLYSNSTEVSVVGHTHSFDTITNRGEAFLSWGGKNFSGTYGPIDAAMVPELGANRLAFMPANAVTIEYSRDGGSTWTDYGPTDSQKINLFNGLGSSFTIGKATSGAGNIATNKYQLRVNIYTSTGHVYTVLNKFVIYLSTSGTNNNWCTIRARKQSDYTADKDTWTIFADKISVSGWSGYNVINTSGITTYGNTPSTQYGHIQFIFGCDTGSTNNSYAGLNINKIFGFGGVGWTTPSTMAKTGHMYTYDSSQNVTFPAGVSAKSFTENGKTLSATYIAKSLTSTKGDMIYASAANTPARLGIGSNGQFLSIADGIPKWVNNPNSDTHYVNYLQIKGNGTEAVKFTQNADKSLNLKPGNNVSISAASGEITISATVPTKSSWNYDDTYVKYSAAQSLNDTQKTQARTNIGAGTITEIKVNGTSKGTSGSVNLTNMVTFASSQTATVAGTNKTTYTYNQPTGDSNTGSSNGSAYFPEGIIMGGTAASAGLVTRGICGVTTPDATTGACNKESLYVNYDGNNDYQSNRQLVLQAGSVGTHYGNNLYQYAAARGDAVKGYCDATYAAKSTAHTHSNKSILDNTTASFTTTDKTNLGNVLNVAAANTNKITTLDGNVVKLTGDQTVSGIKTFSAPTNSNGTEQTTIKIKTANGGAIIFGKEGPNSGSMIRLDQTDGTTRLQFRASSTAGAMVWKQPESGAALYFDFGPNATRTTMPTSGGTLAYTSQIPTALKNPNALTFGKKTYDGSSAQTITASDLGALTSHQSLTDYVKKSDLASVAQTVSSNTSKITTLQGYFNSDGQALLAVSASHDADGNEITTTYANQIDLDNTNATLGNKQDKLVSGNNLKTINGNSLLGSGNLVITGLPEIGYYSGTASESVNINAPNDEYSMQIGTYGLTLDNGTPADAPDNVFTVNSNTLTWNGYNIPYVQLSSSSYLILAGSNGVRKLQICKGTISKKNSSSTATVTLPQSMPNTDYYILLQTATSYQTVMSRITSKKTSSFTVDNISGGASGGTTIWYYVAIYIQ